MQGELAREKRRREDERDLYLEVVRAMAAGSKEGQERWEAWEKRAKWGWHGEGKWGWKRDGGSGSGSSSSKG